VPSQVQGAPLSAWSIRSSGLPVALASDAALLSVTLGVSDFVSARRTIELLGSSRFIGSVALPSRRSE
jgi:hypothetical protein